MIEIETTKSEFRKPFDLLQKIKDLNDPEISNLKMPAIKELALVGKPEENLVFHIIVFVILLTANLIPFIFGFYDGFAPFITVPISIHFVVFFVYYIYVNKFYDVKKIRRKIEINEQIKKLDAEYRSSLQSIDVNYLNYDAYSLKEVLILMDKAKNEHAIAVASNINHKSKILATSVK